MSRPKEEPETVCAVRNLTVEYDVASGPVRAVDAVSFDVYRGEILGLVGQSGSGKSTIAMAMLRLLQSPGKVTGGEVLLENHDLMKLSSAELNDMRWRKLALIPQGAMNALNPVMRVGHQLRDAIGSHVSEMESGSIASRIAGLFDLVGLDQQVQRLFPHELSGGMKQRVCIAMAMALKPPLVIADEPTSALDVVVQRLVAQSLIRIKNDLGNSMIVIGHDMSLMAQIADRIAVMVEGRIVEIGRTADIFASPEHAFTRQLIKAVPPIAGHGKGSSGAEHASIKHRPGAGSEKEIPLLEVRAAGKAYGGGWLHKDDKVTALREVSLSVPESPPRIIAVAGESGSGKSTLGGAILRFVRLDTGSIFFRGRDISLFRGRERIAYRRAVQAVFQDPYAVFNPFYHTDHIFHMVMKRFSLAKGKRDARIRVEAALDKVGLKPDQVLGKHPHQLSGGQRQRLMIARACIMEPELIIADEPVSMVDASLRSSILGIMQRLREENGISFLYITHDLSTAHEICDEIHILYRGLQVESGPVKTVLGNPRHPYTRLLIESIPEADPTHAWGIPKANPEADMSLPPATDGCPFFDLCSERMDLCREKPVTPHHFPDEQRTVACHLYKDEANRVTRPVGV